MELATKVKTVERLDEHTVRIVWRRASGFIDWSRALTRAEYDQMRLRRHELPPWERIGHPTVTPPLDAA